MREIKLRAWDSKEKEMLYSDKLMDFAQFICDKTDEGISCYAHRGTEWVDEGEECGERDIFDKLDNIMQFTGLKDKNGVEIYEGDILRYFEQLVVVEYNNDRFALRWLAKNCYYREDLEYWATKQKIEVIGNIYQNPELLEQENER